MFSYPHLRDGEIEVEKDEVARHRNPGQDLSRLVGISGLSCRHPSSQGSHLCHPGGNRDVGQSCRIWHECLAFWASLACVGPVAGP